jgi:hypothetical protein
MSLASNTCLHRALARDPVLALRTTPRSVVILI